MVKYDLEHLTQADDEKVCGPIQDTEALFVYAMVRGMRMRRVLEIGGLSGYSARNFLKAFAVPEDSVMYTVDINPVTALAPNHRVLLKDARTVNSADLENTALDLVFFDCHHEESQMTMYHNLLKDGMITDRTVIALHDTCLHPFKAFTNCYEVEGGWVHQRVERDMVNTFVEKMGYHAFSLHTPLESHDASMPFRHGITILQKFKHLHT